MKTEDYNTEIILEEFEADALPSLEDLMQEFAAEEMGKNEPPSIGGIRVISETEEKSLDVFGSPVINTSHFERENHELSAALRRVQADFDNYRRRNERERSEHYSFAVTAVVRELLPVIDNFGRALKNAENFIAVSSSGHDMQQFFDGFHLIQQQLEKVLTVLGVQAIPSVGTLFDPHVHEAVATEPQEDLPPNTVTEELMRGYRLGEKLIRPALVKVSI